MNTSNTPIKVIITGATGMVGEGVLHECLQDNRISKILVINRKSCGVYHPKLEEIIHTDFFDVTAIENKLNHYNACLFCLGVSSVGMKEEPYYKMTYTLTINIAETLARLNKSMTFCYISGAGTDSTEQGKLMWARVKGKTENDLKKLEFKKVYNFRPAIISPTKGLKNTLCFYKYLGWLLPIIKLISPNYISTLSGLGKAMINASINGYQKQTLEVKDINILAKL